MNTGKIVYFFRQTGLMHGLDKLKFAYERFKNNADNKRFKKNNPTVVFPPDYMMFEAFNLNYKKYYEGGKQTATWLLSKLQPYKTLEGITFLDWGCGPARVTRHLPDLLGKSCTVFGTDYNPTTIDWCSKNIKTVQFSLNQVEPPLKYTNNTFDVITGISIFTHLSEQRHSEWIQELHRISRKDAILFLTTQGIAFKAKLTEEENAIFDNNQLVIRANVTEGHRVFSAFHPIQLMQELFGNYFEILEHYPGKTVEWGIEQDYWILKKR
jgi:SAM-dependent methyltransferase